MLVEMLRLGRVCLATVVAAVAAYSACYHAWITATPVRPEVAALARWYANLWGVVSIAAILWGARGVYALCVEQHPQQDTMARK